jgi:hypothetical protein
VWLATEELRVRGGREGDGEGDGVCGVWAWFGDAGGEGYGELEALDHVD